MNICIIAPRYPYKDNMSYVFVKKLVDEWAKRGHQCVVMTPFSLTSYFRHKIPYRPRCYKDCSVEENPVEVYAPRYFSFIRLKVWGTEINSWMISRLLYHRVEKLPFIPDVIYCHFFESAVSGWYISKKMNIPLFVASGESQIQNLYPPCRDFSLANLRDVIKGCVCVSAKNEEEAIKQNLVDRKKCIVFPNGTDLTLFRKKEKGECRKKLFLKEKDFIIICVGGFVVRKGQNRIIEAIKLLGNSNIKLMFIGNGNLILEHDSIIFKGRVNNIDLPDYLNAADVFCLPTLAEGCCNAIVEAMACGLPIISSDLPFNYGLLDAHNSILVDPLDVKAISEAILSLYDHPEIRTQMSTISIKRANSLSISNRAESILHFIESQLYK